MTNCEWTSLDYKDLSSEEKHYIKFLDRLVIDQKRAKEKIAAKLAAYKHGLNDKDKPAGILFFPGPSGVGKTFLIRAFAKLLIGDINGLTRIDCANLAHEHSDATLLGSPPGYVGYNEESMLAQEKLNKPWKESHPDKLLAEEQKKLETMNLEIMTIKLDVEDLEKEILDIMLRIEELEREERVERNKENKEKLRNEKAELEKKKKPLEFDLRNKQMEYLRKTKEADAFVKAKVEERKRRPCPSILLFDEIEKIHPKITRILLSIFDTGETKLSNGQKTDFRNCFIFMTSNIGSKRIAEMLSGKGSIGFSAESQKKQKKADIGTSMYEMVMEEITRSDHFPTELVGRIGKENIIIFHPLSDEGMRAIIDVQLQEMNKKLSFASPQTKFIFTQEIKDFIFEETQDPLNKALGARPIENVIKAKIMEPLVNLVIKGETDGGIINGDIVKIDIEEKGGKKKVAIFKAKNKNGVDIIG